MNRLYSDDNLQGPRKRRPDASTDLVCLDPPFNSMRHYGLTGI